MSDSDEPYDDAPRVVIRDRRRLDPITGEVRGGAAAPASDPAGPPAAGPGDQDDQTVDQTVDPAAELAEQLAERTSDLQRVTAEYANYRRRVDRDRLASAELARAGVLSSLLPVLDNIDRARRHGDLTGAFAAVAEQIESTLAKAGLAAYGRVGDSFDPNRHEAFMHSTSPDVDEPTCVEIMRPGYTVGERLLRPAMVAVADPEAPAGEPIAASASESFDSDE